MVSAYGTAVTKFDTIIAFTVSEWELVLFPCATAFLRSLYSHVKVTFSIEKLSFSQIWQILSYKTLVKTKPLINVFYGCASNRVKLNISVLYCIWKNFIEKKFQKVKLLLFHSLNMNRPLKLFYFGRKPLSRNLTNIPER